MESVNVIDAKDRLDALLDEVERGQEVVITRGGKTVARLVPAADRAGARAAADALREIRSDLAAGGVRFSRAELRELRDTGRR